MSKKMMRNKLLIFKSNSKNIDNDLVDKKKSQVDSEVNKTLFKQPQMCFHMTAYDYEFRHNGMGMKDPEHAKPAAKSKSKPPVTQPKQYVTPRNYEDVVQLMLRKSEDKISQSQQLANHNAARKNKFSTMNDLLKVEDGAEANSGQKHRKRRKSKYEKRDVSTDDDHKSDGKSKTPLKKKQQRHPAGNTKKHFAFPAKLIQPR